MEQVEPRPRADKADQKAEGAETEAEEDEEKADKPRRRREESRLVESEVLSPPELLRLAVDTTWRARGKRTGHLSIEASGSSRLSGILDPWTSGGIVLPTPLPPPRLLLNPENILGPGRLVPVLGLGSG